MRDWLQIFELSPTVLSVTKEQKTSSNRRLGSVSVPKLNHVRHVIISHSSPSIHSLYHHCHSPHLLSGPKKPLFLLLIQNINENQIWSSRRSIRSLRLVGCARAAISTQAQGAFDPELRLVFELATDTELYEIERILFGPSYFSPLLKSVMSRSDVDYAMIEEDLEERDQFLSVLESRFLFLAADARSTLRGWRPSYRNVLLAVRKELNIPCSSKLSTEDLEAEIFLHLLRDYLSELSGNLEGLLEFSEPTDGGNSLERGLSQWKVQALTTLKVGAEELRSMLFKGGGIFTVAKIYQLLARKLSGKVFLEAANYQLKRDFVRKGGQLAAINLESRAALLAAKQGLTGATSRYLGLRSMMTLLGPVLWGTFLADVVIQMLGTDYARILRAIYAFAQIRITRTYGSLVDD